MEEPLLISFTTVFDGDRVGMPSRAGQSDACGLIKEEISNNSTLVVELDPYQKRYEKYYVSLECRKSRIRFFFPQQTINSYQKRYAMSVDET